MHGQSIRKKMMRAAATFALGGTLFQLSGCDPAVRAELISGLEGTTQSLSSSLITAFFLSLTDGINSPLTTGQ